MLATLLTYETLKAQNAKLVAWHLLGVNENSNTFNMQRMRIGLEEQHINNSLKFGLSKINESCLYN